MNVIECFNCNREIAIDISKALDENATLFRCPHCGKLIIYGQ